MVLQGLEEELNDMALEVKTLQRFTVDSLSFEVAPWTQMHCSAL